MKIINFTCALVSTYIILYFISLARPYILPLAVATLICFLTIGIAEFYQSLSKKKFNLPGSVAMALSMLTIGTVLFFFGSVINENIQDAIQAAPSYQDKIIAQVNPILQRFNIPDIPELEQAIKTVNLKTAVSSVALLVKNITSNLGMIFIYAVFIFLEHRMFKKKLFMIFDKEKIGGIIEKINADVRKYIVIKSSASFATALLTYAVLVMTGVDFAALWGLLTFLLNFIPTIGSIIAVIPPILLSLVQFEGLAKFLIVLPALVGIQFLIGNFLEPRFAGKSLNLSPLVILLSLLFWGKLLGIVGMFLCVPITVILNLILANFESTRPIAIMLSANGKILKETEENSVSPASQPA